MKNQINEEVKNETTEEVKNEFKEEVKMETQNKSKVNIGLIIIISILCIVIVVLFVFLLKPKEDKKEKPSTSKNDTQESTSIQEDNNKNDGTIPEVTDDALKLDLYHKINQLFISKKEDSSYIESSTYGGYGFCYKVLKDTLTDYDKQQIVLQSSKFDKIDNSGWEKVEKVKNAIEKDLEHLPNAKDEYGYLPYDTLNNLYKKLFGKNLSEPETLVGKCPQYVYSKDTNEFYSMRTACGGASASSVITYISKMLQKENSIDVYLSVGIVQGSSDSSNKYEVYGDFEFGSESISSLKNLITTDENNQYTITSDNYEQFSQYILTFTKDGDNYYFSGVKQIK